MTPLEDDLRNLLKRKEPPADFAERVLARIEAEPPQKSFARQMAAFFRRPMLRWAAVGIACLALAIGPVQHRRREQQRRAQAEQAREQAILALHIASSKLNAALERAQRITVQALAAPENLKTRME